MIREMYDHRLSNSFVPTIFDLFFYLVLRYTLMACALVLIQAELIINFLPSIFERLIVGEQVRLGGLRL